MFERADLIAETTARAAVAAEVPKLVALSSVGADRASGTGWIGMNRRFEQRLVAAGVPTVFLRAAYFMENWTPLVGLAMRNGVLPTSLAPPQRRIPMAAISPAIPARPGGQARRRWNRSSPTWHGVSAEGPRNGAARRTVGVPSRAGIWPPAPLVSRP